MSIAMKNPPDWKALVLSTSFAPALTYWSFENFASLPALSSTFTTKPFFVRVWTTAGIIATLITCKKSIIQNQHWMIKYLFSSFHCSLGTPMLNLLYGVPAGGASAGFACEDCFLSCPNTCVVKVLESTAILPFSSKRYFLTLIRLLWYLHVCTSLKWRWALKLPKRRTAFSISLYNTVVNTACWKQTKREGWI